MTLPEFFGCTLIAFGTPFALFVFTIANDSMRIIILIAAAFFWLLSLLLSSMLWFAIVPLRDVLAFGVVFSVLFQECFRYIIYRILRSTEHALHAVADDSRITENKHILAYVSGLGFGIISGLFALVNVLADMVSDSLAISSKYSNQCSLYICRLDLAQWASRAALKCFSSRRLSKCFQLSYCTHSGALSSSTPLIQITIYIFST